jgi:hypothetical protein
VARPRISAHRSSLRHKRDERAGDSTSLFPHGTAVQPKASQRIEEIGKALGVATKELVLPVKRSRSW